MVDVNAGTKSREYRNLVPICSDCFLNTKNVRKFGDRIKYCLPRLRKRDSALCNEVLMKIPTTEELIARKRTKRSRTNDEINPHFNDSLLQKLIFRRWADICSPTTTPYLRNQEEKFNISCFEVKGKVVFWNFGWFHKLPKYLNSYFRYLGLCSKNRFWIHKPSINLNT